MMTKSKYWMWHNRGGPILFIGAAIWWLLSSNDQSAIGAVVFAIGAIIAAFTFMYVDRPNARKLR